MFCREEGREDYVIHSNIITSVDVKRTNEVTFLDQSIFVSWITSKNYE